MEHMEYTGNVTNILGKRSAINAVSQSTRIPCYDMARGLGILLVVAGHVFPPGTYTRSLIYSFHIPMFFFVSGAVMKTAQAQESHPLYAMLYRERKLLVNYLFYSFVFIIFDVIVRVAWLHQMTWTNIFWDCYQTVIGCGINVLWFLAALTLTKIVANMLLIRIHDIQHQILACLLLYFGFAVAGNIIAAHLAAEGMRQFLYYLILPIIETGTLTPFVMLGHIMRTIMPKLAAAHPVALLFMFIPNIAFCAMFGDSDYHQMRTGFPPLSLLLVITGILAAFGLCQLIMRIPPMRAALNWCSHNSLFIMVTHEYPMIRGLLIIPLLAAISTTLANSAWLQIILLMIVEIPVCMLLRPPADRLINAACRLLPKPAGVPKHASGKTQLSV